MQVCEAVWEWFPSRSPAVNWGTASAPGLWTKVPGHSKAQPGLGTTRAGTLSLRPVTPSSTLMGYPWALSLNAQSAQLLPEQQDTTACPGKGNNLVTTVCLSSGNELRLFADSTCSTVAIKSLKESKSCPVWGSGGACSAVRWGEQLLLRESVSNPQLSDATRCCHYTVSSDMDTPVSDKRAYFLWKSTTNLFWRFAGNFNSSV